jgi:hypothetical protein
MAARNDETYLFVVEWYDPMPQLRRKYLLKYFTEQHAVSFLNLSIFSTWEINFSYSKVEMVDLKTKKIFLKKSPCPDYVTKEDLVLGGKVQLQNKIPVSLSTLLITTFKTIGTSVLQRT